MTVLYLVGAIIAGSALSLCGGLLLLRAKKRRQLAILLTLPFGAGALLAAAFFDLLPEAFHMGDPEELLLWMLGGFLLFFLLERSAGWFHHHHEHEHDVKASKNVTQRRLVLFGDAIHNLIDGLAIGAAFLVSVPTGIITTLAVSAHEVPRELGTFAILLSRGWRGRLVILANIATAALTIIAALAVYLLGAEGELPIGPLLAATAGFFVYIAASDIIPDIHEQPQRVGMVQAAMLVAGVVVVGVLIALLHGGH